MKIHNRIINYFVEHVTAHDRTPRVFRCPLTINSAVAKELIIKQYGKDIFKEDGILLHVCFDHDSGVIYSPNSYEFSKNSFVRFILAAKLRIIKDFGQSGSGIVINGSPYSSFRYRSLVGFGGIKDLFGKTKEIPIIEANLARMPSTIAQLPAIYSNNKDFLGGYVGDNTDFVEFIESIDSKGRKRTDPIHLVRQKTPFILINTSPSSDNSMITPSEKEWVVLHGHREYLSRNNELSSDMEMDSDLYAIRHHLCLGWTFEEVCSLLLREMSDFEEFIIKAGRLSMVLQSLLDDGYYGRKKHPYYISMKFGDDFPLKLQSIVDFTKMRLKEDHQIGYLKIVDVDFKNNYLIIETPVYVSPVVCTKILMAKEEPFICCYNEVVKKIDVKVDSAIQRNQALKILSFIEGDVGEEGIEFRTGPIARGEWAVDANVFNVRNLSEYFSSTKFIKEVCLRYNVEFNDIDVIIGPIERIMGRGSQGGFVSKRRFTGKEPLKIAEGVYMNPPCILINSATMPSYAEQAETLVHEYRHFIYDKQNPCYEKGYGDLSNKKGDAFLEEWDRYLTDDNEKEAHREEILYSLMTGKSPDEIIRDKVGGQITLSNYPSALRFNMLVEEVIKSSEDKNEKSS